MIELKTAVMPDAAALEGVDITTWEQVDWIYREGYKTVLADMRRKGELAICPCDVCTGTMQE